MLELIKSIFGVILKIFVKELDDEKADVIGDSLADKYLGSDRKRN